MALRGQLEAQHLFGRVSRKVRSLFRARPSISAASTSTVARATAPAVVAPQTAAPTVPGPNVVEVVRDQVSVSEA